MSLGKLIFTDAIFVISIILIWYATDGFKKSMGVFLFMIIFAFAACIKWHAEYYNRTKRIY